MIKIKLNQEEKGPVIKSNGIVRIKKENLFKKIFQHLYYFFNL